MVHITEEARTALIESTRENNGTGRIFRIVKRGFG
jgi:hypothetical protein